MPPPGPEIVVIAAAARARALKTASPGGGVQVGLCQLGVRATIKLPATLEAQPATSDRGQCTGGCRQLPSQTYGASSEGVDCVQNERVARLTADRRREVVGKYAHGRYPGC